MLIFLKRIIKLAIVFFTLGLITIFLILWYFSSELPDYKILSNYKPPISSRVHSGDGQLIAEYALQKRLFIPYASIPKKIIYSFLSAEDKNFCNFILYRLFKNYPRNYRVFFFFYNNILIKLFD